MMNMDGNVATKLMNAAIDKGYKTHLFCFGEAVTAVKKGQEPKRFPNLGKELEDLVAKGLEIAVCSTCALARGVSEEELIDGAKIGSLTNDYSVFLEKSKRLVAIAR